MKKLILVLMFIPLVACADWFGRVDLMHVSNPTITEKGYGLNAIFLDIGYKKNGWYVYGGLGIHDEGTDCPEVCYGGNELGRFGAGYTFDF